MIHNSSLYHDDIIDGASIRRNKECAYLKYDKKSAIIAPIFITSQWFIKKWLNAI